MNKSTRTLVVILVATVVAAVASFGVYVRNIPVREVEVAHNYVAVAARSLPNGTRLTEKDVRLAAWPSKHPVEGGFSKVEDVINRGLVTPVFENEPLIEKKLAPIESGAGLPPSIPTGMRAMSVKVDEVVGVAGFVLPGTRVDVVVTLRRQSGNNAEEAMSRTVVSNVLVLTNGTKYEQDQGGEPQSSTVVTLAVTPQDAERVALAATEGKISLALRNPLDVEPTETPGIRVGSLMTGGAPAPAPPAPTAPRRAAPRRTVAAPEVPAVAPVIVPPPPAPYRVEAFRGGKQTEEVVN
jgi:pilus assembly protein CpaB